MHCQKINKLIAAFVFLCAAGTPLSAYAQASACSANEILQTLTIPAGWTAGSTGPVNYIVGTGLNAVTVTYSVVGSQPFTSGTPDQLTHGGIANTVRAGHTTTGTNVLLSTQNLSFDRPVNKFQLTSTDVDYLDTNWQDRIVVLANGGTAPTSMVGAATHTINVATGTATATTEGNCANTDPACNVTTGFNITGINSIAQQFRTGPSHDGAQQFVGIANFAWCAPRRSNITLRKTWVNATINDAITVSATGATPALVNLNSTANSANETDTGVVQTVNVGSVLTLAETFTTGSAANYNTTLACTGTSGLVGSTLTVGSADTNIVCTYTNTKKTATVTLRKSWVNATVNDAVNVTATGLTTLASVANTATEIDSGAAQTVNVGSVLTLAETFTTGSAANYNTTLACTGTSGLVGSTLTVGSADTAIVCTYTNTKKTATVTLRKSWVN
ncbi:MAG TPA: hypothetical protein PKC80_02850, partial [Burkholderiaceae bacterium]|nr:hypothetical protein [Burkholderiaceae bacterium]